MTEWIHTSSVKAEDISRPSVAMKRRCTLDEIHAELRRRIKEKEWASGYCRDCEAPTPYRIPHDGYSNWTVSFASAKPGCEGFLLDLVAALREECELKPEHLGDAIQRLLTWRGWARARRN